MRPTLAAYTYAMQACHAARDFVSALHVFGNLVGRPNDPIFQFEFDPSRTVSPAITTNQSSVPLLSFMPDAKAMCILAQTALSSRQRSAIDRVLRIAHDFEFLPWRLSLTLAANDAESRHEAFWQPKLARALDLTLGSSSTPEDSQSLLRAPFRAYFERMRSQGSPVPQTGGITPVRLAHSQNNARSRRRARRSSITAPMAPAAR